MTVRLHCAAALVVSLLLGACASQPHPNRSTASIDDIAVHYVHLALALNRLHPGELILAPSQEQAPQGPPESATTISRDAQQAIQELQHLPPDTQATRRHMLANLLGALSARAQMLAGWHPSFDDELRALYDVEPPAEVNTDAILSQLASRLPAAPGVDLSRRYVAYLQRYALSGTQLEAAFRTALAVLHSESASRLSLPPNERLDLQPDRAVDNGSWQVRERYLGDAHSRLDINLSQRITLGRVIELAAREGYPGRHVGDILRQANWAGARGWIEYRVLPKYGPLAFIAEGRARVAEDVALPAAARTRLMRQLFRQAGFDPRAAADYVRIRGLGRQLRQARYAAARALCDGRRNAAQTRVWLQRHALMTSGAAAGWVATVERQRSAAVVGFVAGEVVAGWLPVSADADARWAAYRRLTEVPMTPLQLQRHPAQK